MRILKNPANGGSRQRTVTINNKMSMNILISVGYLFDNFNKLTDTVILDCSFQEYPYLQYHRKHIRGTLFFDIDDCVKRNYQYSHILPSAGEFASYVEHLGISNSTHVVCYDDSGYGIYSAARVWFMFALFGHTNVSVLDGGLSMWIKCGYPVSSEPSVKRKRGIFKTAQQASFIKFEHILGNYNSGKLMLIDTRERGRFNGIKKEAVVGVKPGHIKGSCNLPFTEFTDFSTGKFKNADKIRNLFDSYGITPTDPFYYMCSTGITACLVPFALKLVYGIDNFGLYDGSWTDWFANAKSETMDCVPENF